MFEKLRSLLYSYAGIGWTVTGLPIGMGYLARIEHASNDELLEIASELGIEIQFSNTED